MQCMPTCRALTIVPSPIRNAGDAAIWALTKSLAAGHHSSTSDDGLIPLLIALSRADRDNDQGSGGRYRLSFTSSITT